MNNKEGVTNQAYTLPFRSIGKDVIIWPWAKIICPETITISNSVIIDDFVFLMSNLKTEIGNFVHIGSHASIAGGGEFIMEDFSGFSGGVRVYTGNEDYLGGSLTNPTVPFPYRTATRSYVHIKKHVIVGSNSVILPGVTIGEGAVIGANSLVTKDCEPWTIYVGSPVRAMRSRPKEKILELESALRREVFDEYGQYIPKLARNRSNEK